MMFKRIRQLFGYLRAGEYGRARNALTLFALRVLPGGKYAGRHDARGHDLAATLREVYGYDPNRTKAAENLRVSIVIQDGNDSPKSSAFIRLISPLTDPSVAKSLSLRIHPENTTDVGDSDVCIVQRTAYDDIAAARALVRNLSKTDGRLLVDTDDAFSSVDKSHPEYKKLISRVDALNFLLEEAEQVWVSTPKLAETYRNLTAKLTVVPNSLDKRLWSSGLDGAEIDGPIQMVYMGTATHDSDFKMILPTLDKLHGSRPGSFELTTIGVASSLPERPWLSRLVQPPGVAMYPNFVQWFLSQGPFDVGLSPLVDSEFNRGKSDIKCLDYLAAGIMPIVSDVLPYKNPDLDGFIIRVKNTEEAWFKALEDIVRNPAEFRRTKAGAVSAAQDYIWKERSSARTARRLWTLLSKS